MSIKPFLKWAGGKRWLLDREEFQLPKFHGRYIEPFLGGGAVFFSLQPSLAILSDLNPRLIETYQAIKDDWSSVWKLLVNHQALHRKEYFYEQRTLRHNSRFDRAAQFLYLNRACWNGLYRENLKGDFNVPIGSKSTIVFENDNFEAVANSLEKAEITCGDFSDAISLANEGDLLFVDPPYTTAHNFNGFVKYNQKIFSWDDQIRLKDCLTNAASRGCKIISTNAWHKSVTELYADAAEIIEVPRYSVISGNSSGRKSTSESLIVMGPRI